MVAVGAAVPIPLLMPMMVDEVLLNQPGTSVAMIKDLTPEQWHGPTLYVLAILALTVTLRVLALVFSVIQSREFSYIAKDVTYDIRRRLLFRISSISMAAFETMGSGRVASHFVTDVEAIDQFVGTTVAKFIIAVLTLTGTAAVLLWMHWPLALFILFMNPLVVLFTLMLGKRMKALKARENAAFEIFQECLTETLDVIQQLRVSHRERHYLSLVVHRARDIRDRAREFSWKTDAANRLSFLVFLVGFDVFRAVSMLLVVFSDLTLGQMMAVFGYLWFMMSPVQEILGIQYAWFGACAALERINELLATEEEPHYPHRRNPFVGTKSVDIRIHNLTFRYGRGPPVLNGLTLTVPAGEKLAIVGASGGGKSTLVQILLGLYPPQSGELIFGGAAVSEIGLDVVRNNVAVVLQHPALLNDSVRNNLDMGKKLPDRALWQALRVAQLEPDVRTMPEGLDSIVGRQGVRLSGGQQQRLAVARLTLSDPRIVILDEATSALDTQTEADLHRALAPFLEGRTTLIVAHRLSAVKQADRVIVMESGLVIEDGRHEHLLKNGRLYSKLYGRIQST